MTTDTTISKQVPAKVMLKQDVTWRECLRVVDEEKEIVCGGRAVGEIMVRNIFGLFAVDLCGSCMASHRAFYEALRRNKKSARK